MRSFLFSLAYWILSGFYVLLAALASLVAGPRAGAGDRAFL